MHTGPQLHASTNKSGDDQRGDRAAVIYAEIPFRVRIGIISSNALANSQEIAESIRSAFESEVFAMTDGSKVFDLFDEDSKREIRLSCNTPVAFSVLTSLAGSADYLIAEEILKKPLSKIELVLPAAKGKYLRSFVPAECIERFEILFKMARRPITLDQPSADLTPQAIQAACMATGRYIVDHCDVLFTVCDGNSVADVATEILVYAHCKGRPVITVSAGELFEVKVERGVGLSARSISGIQRFNAFSITEAEQNQYVNNVYDSLFKDGFNLPEEAKTRAKGHLLLYYVRASKLAKRNQRIYRWAGLMVYCFSAAAVAAVAVGTLVHNLSSYAFGLELLLLLAILALVVFADRRRAHKNWIESRFLAERIRSAVFLMVSGVEVSRIHVPPYLGTPDQPDDWMNIVFDEIWSGLPPMSGCEEARRDAISQFIRKSWVQNQIGFHEGKVEEYEKKSNWLEVGGIVTFSLALAAAATHLALFFSGYGADVVTVEKILTFLAITLPAVGAAVGGIRAHREYSRLAKRSKNMVMNLKRLDDRFSELGDSRALERLLRETEELMLVETQDWLMLMSFAKVEVGA
jgi:hypothetical protein